VWGGEPGGGLTAGPNVNGHHAGDAVAPGGPRMEGVSPAEPRRVTTTTLRLVPSDQATGLPHNDIIPQARKKKP